MSDHLAIDRFNAHLVRVRTFNFYVAKHSGQPGQVRVRTGMSRPFGLSDCLVRELGK